MQNIALIKVGVVVNVIVVDDWKEFAGSHAAFVSSYDVCVPVSDEAGGPGMGWLYDGTNFSEPPPPPPDDGP